MHFSVKQLRDNFLSFTPVITASNISSITDTVSSLVNIFYPQSIFAGAGCFYLAAVAAVPVVFVICQEISVEQFGLVKRKVLYV